MLRTRAIPCLLLRRKGLVKTIKFKDANYVGDPVNAVNIYNKKEVDELIILDITATVDSKEPDFKLVEEIAGECFMPFAYGGGLRNMEQIKRIFKLGAEKVAVNSMAAEDPSFITKVAEYSGSQSLIISIDVKKSLLGGYKVFTRSGTNNTSYDPVSYARNMEKAGAGELLLTSIDRDGTLQGYDTKLIGMVSNTVSIPVIACGGAGEVSDFKTAVDAGASAVAAGSMVVYQGQKRDQFRNRAVLTNFPFSDELRKVFGDDE